MGCNCKKRQLKNAQKYSEDPKSLGPSEKMNLVTKFFYIIAKILLGILVAAIFIVVAIPLLIYICICVIIGKESVVKIDNFVISKGGQHGK